MLGIRVHGVELKISQYADDTSVMLDGSDEALNETLSELDNYAKISGSLGEERANLSAFRTFVRFVLV